MKVSELIEALKKFDQNKRVIFAQANGDINMWCEKVAIQRSCEDCEEDNNSDVEIIIIQEW